MSIEDTSASKTAIMNTNTAASIIKDIEIMIKNYREYMTADRNHDGSKLLESVTVAIGEEVQIRKQFNAINDKCLQVIDLANKARPDLPSGTYQYTPDELIADAYLYIGHAYAIRNKLPEARSQFVKSLEVLPNSSAQFNLGIILEEEGKKQEAISAFQKVVTDFPNSELAIEANKKLTSSEKIASGRSNWTVTLILSIFLGTLGFDRFYLGYTGLGFLKLVTLGGCGVLYLIDIILILIGKMKDANGKELTN
ncbi:MAG: NINE protein [Endomicrobiaceae bacterium]|nr:NINE protein [Endomicrobiaceae bacterium]